MYSREGIAVLDGMDCETGQRRRSVEEIFRGLSQKTMKWSSYFPVYQSLVAPFAGKPVTIVEIGVLNGGSLVMWRELLGPDARIIGVDVNENARRMEEQGFEIFIGDQADEGFWDGFFQSVGEIDVLVDDGGHTNRQQIVTLTKALPRVRDGGVVIIEDTHASFMKGFANPSPRSFMSFAKHVADCIQARSPHVTHTSGAPFAGLVHAVTFYESMVAFRVDRRLAKPAEEVHVGREEIGAVCLRHAFDVQAYVEGLGARIARVAGPGAGKRMTSLANRAVGRAMRFSLARENARLKSYFRVDPKA